jgi:CheY-like chemotaxis protein
MTAPESKTPIATTPVPAVPSAHPEPAAAGRRPGVLLVDDAPVVRSLLGQVLRQHGFDVWIAPDGKQALDVYAHHQDVIDVVVLDKGMPRLDGLQTLDALLRLDPQVRCCFLTGDLLNAVEADLRQRGAVHVLYKPVAPEEIALVLHKLAGRPRDAAPSA